MKYGLIGEKLSHSFSKEIHESLSDYEYELCEIAREELSSFLSKREFCAINVTIPYKKEVIPHLDEISPEAEELEAVNVIVNRGGRLCGYNTDYDGMRDLILRSGIDLKNKKVLILGTGGTSRTSSLVAKDLGASEVIFVSREKKDGTVDYLEATTLHTDADVIINATPVGMYPNNEECPITLDSFNNLLAVFDAIYNPLRTPLVLEAKKRGIHAEGGLYMLVSQAVKASELFTGAIYDAGKTDEIFNKISTQKENVVLIGMPSSGKSTVGSLLSKLLDKPLVDMDDEIVAHIGMPIAEFFKTHTEEEFRYIESEICKRISKRSGIIIATGGGCILKDENVDALRSNGRLYFLDRSPKSLVPTDDRPLATNKNAIIKLFEERFDRYLSVCDIKVNGDLTPLEEAKIITEEFYSER